MSRCWRKDQNRVQSHGRLNPTRAQHRPAFLIGDGEVLHLDTKGLGLLEPDNPNMAKLRLASHKLTLQTANDHRLEEVGGNRALCQPHRAHTK